MKTHRITLAVVALALAATAHAEPTYDKTVHAVGSAAFAGIVTTIRHDELQGFGAAVLLGAAKEGYDALHQPQHDPSWRDFGADVLGAYIGAKLAGVVLIPERHGLTVGFVRSF